VLAVLLLLPTLAGAASQAVSVRTVEPRGFGYFVGDIFRREVELVVPEAYRLDKASAPAPGRLNYWLDLRAVDLSETNASGARRYRLSLDYQTFYVPLSPTPFRLSPSVFPGRARRLCKPRCRPSPSSWRRCGRSRP
jgi:mxaA protein